MWNKNQLWLLISEIQKKEVTNKSVARLVTQLPISPFIYPFRLPSNATLSPVNQQFTNKSIMKPLTIFLFLIIVPISAIAQEWDKKYERAKLEFQNQNANAYYTEIRVEHGFTYEHYLLLDKACKQENPFFRLEYKLPAKTMRFYHNSDIDAQFISSFINASIGDLDLTVIDMAPYHFGVAIAE